MNFLGGEKIGVEWIVGLLLGIAMFYDWKCYRIPNWVIIFGLVVGLFNQINLHGWRGWMIYFSSVILTGIVLFPLFYLRMFGAGDIKLFIMIGGIHGWHFVIKYFVIALIVGAIYSVCKMCKHQNLFSRLRYLASYLYILMAGRVIQTYEIDRKKEDTIIPFAVPMGLAYGIDILMIKYW